MTLFWVKGYHATSLKDLEAALKMRPGSIYAAFQSKEALFRAALDRYSQRMGQELQATIDQADSPLDAIQAHLLGLAQLAPCDRPSTACMLVKSLLETPDDSDLRRLILTHFDAVETRLAEVFARAIEQGELPPDTDATRLARRLQTYIFGLKVQAQRETDPERMRQLCQDLSDEIGRLKTAS